MNPELIVLLTSQEASARSGGSGGREEPVFSLFGIVRHAVVDVYDNDDRPLVRLARPPLKHS